MRELARELNPAEIRGIGVTARGCEVAADERKIDFLEELGVEEHGEDRALERLLAGQTEPAPAAIRDHTGEKDRERVEAEVRGDAAAAGDLELEVARLDAMPDDDLDGIERAKARSRLRALEVRDECVDERAKAVRVQESDHRGRGGEPCWRRSSCQRERKSFAGGFGWPADGVPSTMALVDSSDATIAILTSIRDEVKETNGRFDLLREDFGGLRKDFSGLRKDFSGLRDEFAGVTSRVDVLGQRLVESELRTATALIELSASVQDLSTILRSHTDLRPRVERCEREIEAIKTRIPRGPTRRSKPREP